MPHRTKTLFWKPAQVPSLGGTSSAWVDLAAQMLPYIALARQRPKTSATMTERRFVEPSLCCDSVRDHRPFDAVQRREAEATAKHKTQQKTHLAVQRDPQLLDAAVVAHCVLLKLSCKDIISGAEPPDSGTNDARDSIHDVNGVTNVPCAAQD